MAQTLVLDDYDQETLDPNNKLSPIYRRPGSLTGYTGYYSHRGTETHELEQSCEKYMIRGYTGNILNAFYLYLLLVSPHELGFRPYRRSAVGEPVVPSLERQFTTRSLSLSGDINITTEKAPQETTARHFRTFVKHVDTVERYNTAVEQLLERGQTQEMLLRIVQSKLSERIHSYASQVLRWRQIFDSFDSNGDGVLDESEFRICLEKQNVQFDDVQCLALFAYFDTNYDGLVIALFIFITCNVRSTSFVEWNEFADFSMVQNPRGGSAVVPKMITTMAKTKQSDLSNIREIPNYLHHTKQHK